MQATIKDDLGQILQVINLESKNFKTGSRGYSGNGRAVINGKKHTVNCILVEIGSGKKTK